MAAEIITSEKPSHLEVSERKFGESMNKLFGGEYKWVYPNKGTQFIPYTTLCDGSDVRQTLGCVLQARINLLQDERDQTTKIEPPHPIDAVDIAIKGLTISTAFDFDVELIKYRRALDVTNGKRANATSLITVIGELTDVACKDSSSEYAASYEKLPNIWWGLAGKDKWLLNSLDKEYAERQAHMGNIYTFVQNMAPQWASEARQKQRTSPIK